MTGIKEAELDRLGPCAICRKPLLGNGDVSFYRVQLTRAIFERRAIEKRVGLQMMIGSGAIARVLGPDEDLAVILDGPHEVAVHESCADIGHLLAIVPLPEEPSGDGEGDDEEVPSRDAVSHMED
jgi:hypothetical protein